MGGVRPSPILFFQEEMPMNTINSLGLTTREGLKVYSAEINNTAQNQIPKPIRAATGSESAEKLLQSAENFKSDTQYLQKLSDLVTGGKLQFNINSELGSVVVKIVDPKTDAVLKEIPSEDIQKLKIQIRKTIGIIFDELI